MSDEGVGMCRRWMIAANEFNVILIEEHAIALATKGREKHYLECF